MQSFWDFNSDSGKLDMQTVIVSNLLLKQFFVQTLPWVEHLEQMLTPNSMGETLVDRGWVSVVHYLPQGVVPRPGFEDGVLRTREDVIRLFYNDCEQVPNPRQW